MAYVDGTTPYSEAVKVHGKIFVVGPAGSGKSLAARLLAARLKLQNRDASVAECGEVIIKRLARVASKFPWSAAHDNDARWVEFISERKPEYRDALRELGDQLTAENPAALVKECITSNIIVGVRRFAEACSIYTGATISVNKGETIRLQRPHGCADIWIYVDRASPTPPAADLFDRDFFEKFCPVHIFNGGNLENLEREVARVAAEICGQ